MLPQAASMIPPEASHLKLVFENAPILGVIVVCVVVLLVAVGRVFGFATIVGDKSRLVGNDKVEAIADGVAAIGSKIEAIEKRIGEVEHDVTTRATRDEVHRLELSFTRMEGRFDSLSMTMQATSNAVSRIEDFMYTAATRRKQDGS